MSPLRTRDRAWWRTATPAQVLLELVAQRSEVVRRHQAQPRRRRRSFGVSPDDLHQLRVELDQRAVDPHYDPPDLESTWIRTRVRSTLVFISRIPAVGDLLHDDPELLDATIGLICALIRDVALRGPFPDEPETERLRSKLLEFLADFVVELAIRNIDNKSLAPWSPSGQDSTRRPVDRST
jgi:hypothetical protein